MLQTSVERLTKLQGLKAAWQLHALEVLVEAITQTQILEAGCQITRFRCWLKVGPKVKLRKLGKDTPSRLILHVKDW